MNLPLDLLATWDHSQLSNVIAHLVNFFSKDDSPFPCCKHGVALNERICTTLVCEASCSDSPTFGLYNIVDLTYALTLSRLETVQYIPEEFFEASAEEEAISADEFYKMHDWTTRTCCKSRPAVGCVTATPKVEKRKWGHMLFLSHAWTAAGVPGSKSDLERLKKAVKRYIHTILDSESEDHGTTVTVKNVATADDFGVWLDFPIIPNDQLHVRSCVTCKEQRRLYIAKMTSLQFVATTIVLHPEEVNRGWILHEMTVNSHGNIIDVDGVPLAQSFRLQHVDRFNLMLDRRVSFTNGSDGVELRCHEFIRLGQLPRCWPSVNRVLLEEWKLAGIRDEGSVDAKGILFKYARSFHHDCQRLKRAMITLPQKLARTSLPSIDENPNISEGWVKVPTERPNPLYSNKMFLKAERDTDAPFSFAEVLAYIENQKRDMLFLSLDPSICDAAAVLQKQQFLGVVMGLRAELLHGAGALHWITLSTLVQALTAAKRTVRLKEGKKVVFNASCTVAIAPFVSRSDSELADFAADIQENGVHCSILEHAINRRYEILRPDFEPGRSGRTAAWSEDR
jgi:hypothetical protein